MWVKEEKSIVLNIIRILHIVKRRKKKIEEILKFSVEVSQHDAMRDAERYEQFKSWANEWVREEKRLNVHYG